LSRLLPRFASFDSTEDFLPFLVRLLAQIIVDSMHERKVEMARRVRGFIGLPGGYGTFEEVRINLTWRPPFPKTQSYRSWK